MSEQSLYLRDQAHKCRWHANNIGDAETEKRLRKPAADYDERAVLIENKKQAAQSARGKR
jgi:hypothetical protein